MKNAKTSLLFSALCLMGATRWLLPGSDTAPPEASGWALAAGALLAMLFAWGLALRPRSLPPTAAPLWSLGGGALLLMGSNLPVWFRPPGISASEVTLALALTTVVIAVAGQALEEHGREDLAGRLWPGLVVVAGLLLVLPEPHLGSWRALLVLALMPVLTGFGATVLSRGATVSAWNLALALTGAFAAALVGAASHAFISPLHSIGDTGPFLGRAAWDGISLLLSFAVLMRLGALRWSAVFAVVPLLMAAESVVLSGGAVNVRLWLATALLLLASVCLLKPPEEAARPTRFGSTA